MILAHPSYLYLLLILIPIALLMYYSLRREISRIKKISEILANDSEQLNKRLKHTIISYALLIAGLTCLIFSLAEPLGKGVEVNTNRRAVDVMIALDISRSMYAEDIKPSRLQRAKIFGQELIQNLRMERLGLIVFAADAYISMPLSLDHSAASLYLKSANPISVSNQGTSIGSAIKEFLKAVEEEEERNRVMIIISDGEDHDQQAVEAAELARSKGVHIYTIGVGTEEGAQIIMSHNNRTFKLKDDSGNPVISKYQPDFLKEVAHIGGGVYYDILAGRKIIGDLKQRIEKMDKEQVAERTIESRSTFYYIPLLLGIIFLFTFVIIDRKLIKLPV